MRFLKALLLLMALPATENFTGAAGALAGSWTQHAASGTATVNRDGSGLGTQSAVDASVDRFVRWTGDTFGNDQYSQMTVKGVANAVLYNEVTVRAAGNAGTFACYVLYTDGVNGATHTELSVWNAAIPSVLCSFSPPAAFVNGDVMKIQVVGNVITCYKNGVVMVPSTGGTSVTDSTLSGASSSPGLGSFWGSGATPPTFDDWQGDNYPPTVTAPRLRRIMAPQQRMCA